MYHKPFGSIFGVHLKPKYTTAVGEAATGDENLPSVESTKNEPKKGIVDTIPFEETTEMEDSNPKLHLTNTEFELAQKQLQFKLLQMDIESLKRRIPTSQRYAQLLTEYLNLTNDEKQKIKSWIKTNTDSIASLIAAKKLQKEAAKTQIKNAESSAEIKHLEDLTKLQKQGIDIAGSPVLKYYRPIRTKVTDALPLDRNIPKIFGKTPMDELYGLKQLGQFEDSYYVKFKNKQLAPSDYMDARRQAYNESQIGRKTEKMLLVIKQIDWKTKDLTKEKNQQLEIYNNEKKQVVDLINQINTDPDSKSVTTTIGVLLDTLPEKFENLNLLDALQTSLKNKPQLGQEDTTPPTDNTPQQILAQANQNAQNAQREQLANQVTLNQLQTQVSGGSPAPPIIPIFSSPIITINTEALIKKLLPWIIGIIILMNVIK